VKKLISNIDTYNLVFLVLIFSAVLTYIIPVGSFSVEEIKYSDGTKIHTKKVINPSSFSFVYDENGSKVKNKVVLFKAEEGHGFFNSIFDGLTSGSKWSPAVGVIAFLLIIGGAFGIITRTGAVEVVIFNLVEKIKNYEWVLISTLFIVFSLGGAIFGMAEEALPFIIILLPVFIKMGYDSMTALLTIFVATQVGFTTSWMNPFSIAIAQGISNIPVLSGAVFRIIMWFFFTTLTLIMVLIYAKKVKSNPHISVTYDTDREIEKKIFLNEEKPIIKLGHILVVSSIFLGILWVVYGVVFQGYYIPEIATQFFIMGFVTGLIAVFFKLNNMTFNSIPQGFREGASQLLGAAMIVGFAKAIIILMGGDSPENPSILNTIIHYAGSFIKDLPTFVSAWFMYIFHNIFNFFVVSGSGKAALTMPLMAPLSDMVGLSRQVAVLAFQLGDGFTNMIVPTSAVLMGILGVAKVEWLKWFKFQFKFQAMFFVFGSIFIFIAILINYN